MNTQEHSFLSDSFAAVRHTRRNVLKIFALGAAAVFAAPLVSRAYAAEDAGAVLVLYFSHSGNTRALAEMIHKRVGGDIAELKTVSPYPADYDAVVDMAKKEQNTNARPQLAEIPRLEEYSTVFIGYPNWWGTLPMAYFTLLEKHSLAGKTVIPFCTHEGSRFGRSESDLRKLCPNARILKGFEVRGRRVSSAQEDVDEWLKSLGFSVKGL